MMTGLGQKPQAATPRPKTQSRKKAAATPKPKTRRQSYKNWSMSRFEKAIARAREKGDMNEVNKLAAAMATAYG